MFTQSKKNTKSPHTLRPQEAGSSPTMRVSSLSTQKTLASSFLFQPQSFAQTQAHLIQEQACKQVSPSLSKNTQSTHGELSNINPPNPLLPKVLDNSLSFALLLKKFQLGSRMPKIDITLETPREGYP